MKGEQHANGEPHDRPTPGLRTVAVHAGQRDSATGAVGTPIYQCSTFELDRDKYAQWRAGHARETLIYSRYGNPSQWAVQDKLAALEGAEAALVLSSGMAAISATLVSLTEPGGHIVASSELYGGTHSLLSDELPRMGFGVSRVDPTDPAAIEAAIRPATDVLYFELLSNPTLKLLDIERVAAIAHRHGAKLVVDATFATPVACRPLARGADVVVHSATKYLAGHSDLVAGAVAGSRSDIDRIWPRLVHLGGCLDPHACFLLERSLKTLPIRLRAHAESAGEVARWLKGQPAVKRVMYPGLPSHPQYPLARRQLDNMTGNLAFVVHGGDAAAQRLADELQLPRQAVSLGGVESLVCLPFNSTHSTYSESERTGLGIEPGFVRYSVGIEDAADLIADLERALAIISETTAAA